MDGAFGLNIPDNDDFEEKDGFVMFEPFTSLVDVDEKQTQSFLISDELFAKIKDANQFMLELREQHEDANEEYNKYVAIYEEAQCKINVLRESLTIKNSAGIGFGAGMIFRRELVDPRDELLNKKEKLDAIPMSTEEKIRILERIKELIIAYINYVGDYVDFIYTITVQYYDKDLIKEKYINFLNDLPNIKKQCTERLNSVKDFSTGFYEDFDRYDDYLELFGLVPHYKINEDDEEIIEFDF